MQERQSIFARKEEFMMWSNWMGGDGFGWGGGMIGVGLLSILLVGLAVWAAVRYSGPASARRGPESRIESPLDTLKRRLASGEINSSEYEEKRRLLS
jgi:putative membrane protein